MIGRDEVGLPRRLVDAIGEAHHEGHAPHEIRESQRGGQRVGGIRAVDQEHLDVPRAHPLGEREHRVLRALRLERRGRGIHRHAVVPKRAVEEIHRHLQGHGVICGRGLRSREHEALPAIRPELVGERGQCPRRKSGLALDPLRRRIPERTAHGSVSRHRPARILDVELVRQTQRHGQEVLGAHAIPRVGVRPRKREDRLDRDQARHRAGFRMPAAREVAGKLGRREPRAERVGA